MEELIKYYFDCNIKVRFTDLGIENYVTKHNSESEFRNHLSFNEFKSKANSGGYHEMSIIELFKFFGKEWAYIDKLIDNKFYIIKKAESATKVL